MTTVVCDHRERNGARPYLQKTIDDNNFNHTTAADGGKISYVEKQMTVGDYSIISGDHVLMIIERKTWADLSASIIDKRCDEQYDRMLKTREATGCRLVIIIEGKRVGATVSPAAMIGKLDSWVVDGMPYITTKGPIDTAEQIVRLARSYCRKMNKWSYSPDIIVAKCDHLKASAAAECKLLESIAMEDRTEAGGGADVLTARTSREDDAVIADMWAEMGVSAKIAEAIATSKKFSIAEFVVMDAGAHSAAMDSLRQMQYDNGRRFGKNVDDLAEACYSGNDAVKIAQAKKRAMKVLSAIPSIGPKAATVLSAYSLRDISRLTEADIANISVGKSKLGPAKAGKIVHFLTWKKKN